MRATLGLSDNQMALLQGSALALPVVAAAIPLGFIIDRRTRTHLLWMFAVLDGLGSLLTATASSFGTLFLARCLVGLAMTAIIITGFSMVADLYLPAQRGRAKAVLVLGQYGGTSAAFALGGVLLGLFKSPDGWRWVVLWLTGVPLILAMLSVRAIREPIRTGVVVQEPSTREGLAELWRYRPVVVPLMAGIVLSEMVIYAIVTWSAPMLSRAFHIAPDGIGALMGTVMAVSGICGPMIGGVLADLCQRTGGSRRTMAALSLLSVLAAPAGLFAIMSGVAPTSALLIVCTTLVAAIIAMGVTLYTIVVPNELRGLCFAISAAMVSLFGVSVGPVTVSLLSGVIGGPAAIGRALALVCVTGSLLCGATFALGRRNFPGNAAS